MNPTKIIKILSFTIAAMFLLNSKFVSADIIGSVIQQTFQKHNSSFVCLTSRSSIADIRIKVESQLKKMGANKENPNDVAKAIYLAFPCPFSPNRTELRKAKKNDIEGVWIFPATSQKLKFGPRSPLWAKFRAAPIKCESIAYYPGGELRHAVIVGQFKCPFSKASDMNMSRSNPKVASWEIIEDGVVKVSRTDVKNHIEEWSVFTVTEPFEMYKIKFETGDLVAYIKRENGNEFNVATQFRHLKKLK